MATTRSPWLLLIYLGFAAAWMSERPVLESRDGNLFISGAKDRNITLKIQGRGYVNVNEINLLHVASAAQNATRLIERWRMGYLAEVENNLQRLTDFVEGPMGLQRRVSLLEGVGDTNGTFRPSNGQPNQPSSDAATRNGLRRVNDRVRRLEERVRIIVRKLRENECQSNPCQNGGTCQDLYDGYQCHCTPNWEGPNCMTDVNECVKLLGTDLGCQNGATCFNLPGSFRCDCAPAWYGLHCTKKTSVCNTQNSDELCGHGVCVSKLGSALGYTCICDQGWESDGTNPACTKDVDECAGRHPPCSVNPPVACRNAPGTFFCDSCPHGYTGNGYYCSDIDECLVDNGGCSVTPRVQCINTMGSRVCGPCPAGYRGDGVTCYYVGGCAVNNGGCHPLASCVENPALTSAYVLCRCPAGYTGDGMGPNGCQIATGMAVNSPCASNPCVHGTCVPGFMNAYTCRCNSGYTGITCSVPVDPCSPNPCRNNGVCLVSNGAVTCDCPATFTGSRCETPRQTCGGVSRNPVGHLEFPIGGNTYQHGLSCAWVLYTNHSLVLNVSFTKFNVEQSADCKFDFLQIHDGRNAGSHMIGRFCGNSLPNGRGNIVSSHNALYFWFHSDSSVSHEGFAFHWNSIEPVCGDYLNDDYGTITSPGSPGRYPPNRDCYWRIFVRPTKRIQFHFGQLMLEEHPTCANDYVEITGADENERLGLYCNHSHPAPLITPGYEATVHFHSDEAGQDSGFQIHYSIVEGIPGCSGVFTAFTGIISPPSHTTTYQPNMECEWKVQLPAGERIKATWLKFDLEESTSCQFDYVEIFDGGDTDSPLIGRYCGSDVPPTIKTNSNAMLVLFRSDWSFEKEGFALSYEVLCGGEFTEETGILQSPMYPNAYHGSRTCTYEIMQPPERTIVLTIEDLDIEGRSPPHCYFDYLEVFDGDSENSTQLATLCGSEEFIPADPYYSTHNFMLLKFTSDSSIEGRGFKANYTTIERRCGGLYKTPTGVIQSPSDNGYYGYEENCIWTIQAPPGHVVQLSWLSFRLEPQMTCRHDYVSVYENYVSEEKELLGTFCGSRKPPILMSQGRTMTVVFRTDTTVTAEGFVASYIFIDASKVCGGHFTKLNGVIRSPNYPQSYPNNKECVWVIEAPNRQRVVLNVENFELEGHGSCSFDYVEIRNGGHDLAPLVGRYCGTEIPTEIISQTNLLYVKFVSDSSRQDNGFNIEWDSTTAGCGGTLSAASGDIISPYYPQPYAHSANCYWKIAVAAGSLVQLVIVDLDLEQHSKCRYDYIEISDGIERRTNSRRYCDSSHPKIILSKSNTVTVRFRSDHTNFGHGFHLKYETVCHNKVRGFYGAIESPNYPNKYAHNVNCSWTIEAPKGNKVNLTFYQFDLEGVGRQDDCQYDYLEVKEGTDDVPNTELGKFCNSEDLPPKISSSQHQVFITFITDAYVAFNGFRLEWVVHGCGGHLTRPFDDLTSPGYPNAYQDNIDCEWLIEVDYSHSVELTFHEINMERNMVCMFDKLSIYEGEDESAPLLAKMCHSDKPVVYTSTGNKMFLKFHSDVSYAGRGFSASYKSVPITCGGKFTANSGVIHSANYPQNYPHQQNCEWLLQVDKNHVVNITFQDFDVENSRNCTDDHVKIFDGPTKDSPLLATLCRNELPPSYVSSSNEMLVVMRSDIMISAKGFKATYSRACGARIIVKDQGYLAAPLTGTNSLQHENPNCTWILVAEDPADHVTVTFTHMEMEIPWYPSCNWQYIQVLEGEGMEGPSRGKWCSNKAPPPVTSTGNALTVHLYLEYEYGSRFAVTYSVLNSACGGNYTSQQGTIASPGYPDSYPLNSECIWILNTSPGNRIKLTFSKFDLQQSENCDLDYLEIREDSGIGKLLSISCGTSIDEVVSSSKLWIKFKSDGKSVGEGFVGDYEILGGNELEGPAGRITSPLYPLPYKQEAVFTWRVTVEFGFVIRFDIRDLFIENAVQYCSKSLKIHDGYDQDAPALLEVCGVTAPEPVVSSSNIAYVVMTTDQLREGSWFDLTWLQIPKDSMATGNEEIKLSACSEEVALIDEHNNTYSFHSPGWPNGYGHNLECTWLFTSPPGTHLVLRILSMNLEESTDCVSDAVSVYSGNAVMSESTARLEKRLCLSNATMSVVKTSNVMTVKFETDSYVNRTGFRAYVYRICGGELTGPNGVIEVDNTTAVRGIHTWHVNCEWNVTVKPGRTIEVKITEMPIADSASHTCSDNYVLLKNGGEITSPLLGAGKYCGDVTPAPLQTTGNRLYVKVSGITPNVRFKLTYRQINMNCGGEFVLSNREKEWMISTPNYPNIPPPYSECSWTAMAPAGEKISIHFVDRFDLSYSENCEKEYVEIRDGGTEHAKLLGRYCKDTAPSSMITTGNVVYIHFYSDIPEPKNGFRAVINTGEVCGGILRGKNGVINSPNYPFFYPKNQTCRWWIIAPTDHTIKIDFRDFHLPGFRRCSTTDHVEIYEKIAENDTLSGIGTYCGMTKPDLIETSSNTAYVTFRSDSREYITYRGFSLNFTSSEEICGGELTAMTGIIKSKGYPNPGRYPRYCDWRIKLPKGFQVVVDILDLDIVGASAPARPGSYSLSFYNDLRFKSRIKVLGQSASTEQIRSSGNTMMIGYWSSSEYRGFKLRYSASAPAPCGGEISEERGTLTGPKIRPFNESSYFCQWSLKPPENLAGRANSTGVTLTIKVSGIVGGMEGHYLSRHCFYSQYIGITDVGMICGNLTQPRYLRSPKPVNELTIVNGTYGKQMNFDLEYQWQPCGGILSGPETYVIRAPKNISYPINCAWYANYPDTGEVIKLYFTKLNLGSCETGYITIRNGGPLAPEIGKFCGNIKPYNITSTSNQLWIEYFAAGDPNEFEFNVESARSGCGGAQRGRSREISSPEFPKQYPNNAECTWEITASNGYHIGLTFVDRFSLETSANCEKDYVQVFDWVKDSKLGDSWKDLGKVCGRNTPNPFNSTSNRMKVTFHSNEAIQADGFRALWNENCGGVFEVTTESKIIQSPAYPNMYRPNLFCNYTLVAPDQDIVVDFTEFQLERGRGDCRFDNVTITSEESSLVTDNGESTWCGENKPPILRAIGKMEIIFRTDKYIQRNGFQFSYFINECGGIMTAPGDIKPRMQANEYFGHMNCTWIIKAPEGNNVVVRFESFVLEYSLSCYFDYVAVYDGQVIDDEKKLGLVCGNLTENLPVFKSASSSMIVTFNADGSRQYEGFRAKVLFTKSPAAGCGGSINLTSTESRSFRTQKGSTYDSLEDCHWTVVTGDGKNIVITINSMDIKNATNNTGSPPSDKCTGDYLEIRDGAGPYSELLGQYCGSVVPPPIISTTNTLWIRFYSDGTVEGTGVTATIQAVESLCGPLVLHVNNTKQVLTSPQYPHPYAAGVRCRWTLLHPKQFVERLLIRFVDFNLTDSKRCDTDFLEITDVAQRRYVNEGFGENLIFSGNEKGPVTIEMGSRLPMSSYKYCGSALPHDYYSYSNDLEITFKTEVGGHKGFKLEYVTASCDQNYTAEQGRIIHQGFTDCWITITAPANHTISLYFSQFRLYDREQCTKNALQVRDGDFNGNLLALLCGVETPSPIFSTGNKLSLHSWSGNGDSYWSYDFTYTTTSEGRGCGGRLFNYGGRFTSPLYPNPYRNNTVCTWDVSVPRGFVVSLKFDVLDIGTKINCPSNNVKIYDALPDGERALRTTYCGGDEPALFEAAGNQVFVTYTSTVNNIGTGWVILFMGRPTAHNLNVIYDWSYS